jgi:hypothetical protein
MGIGTEAAQFPAKEYTNGISVAVWVGTTAVFRLLSAGIKSGIKWWSESGVRFPALALVPLSRIFPQTCSLFTVVWVRGGGDEGKPEYFYLCFLLHLKGAEYKFLHFLAP